MSYLKGIIGELCGSWRLGGNDFPSLRVTNEFFDATTTTTEDLTTRIPESER